MKKYKMYYNNILIGEFQEAGVLLAALGAICDNVVGLNWSKLYVELAS